MEVSISSPSRARQTPKLCSGENSALDAAALGSTSSRERVWPRAGAEMIQGGCNADK